jgi:hypothetical protein
MSVCNLGSSLALVTEAARQYLESSSKDDSREIVVAPGALATLLTMVPERSGRVPWSLRYCSALPVRIAMVYWVSERSPRNVPLFPFVTTEFLPRHDRPHPLELSSSLAVGCL